MIIKSNRYKTVSKYLLFAIFLLCYLGIIIVKNYEIKSFTYLVGKKISPFEYVVFVEKEKILRLKLGLYHNSDKLKIYNLSISQEEYHLENKKVNQVKFKIDKKIVSESSVFKLENKKINLFNYLVKRFEGR